MPVYIYKKTNAILDYLSQWVSETKLSPVKDGKVETVHADGVYEEFKNFLKTKTNYKWNTRFIGRSLSLFHNIRGKRGENNQHLFIVNRDCTLLKPSVVKIDLTTDTNVEVNINKCKCGGDCVLTPLPANIAVQGATGPGLPAGFMGNI